MGELCSHLGARWFDIGFLTPAGRADNPVLRSLVLSDDEVDEAINLYIDGLIDGRYSAFKSRFERAAQSSRHFKLGAEIPFRLPYLTEWPWNRIRIDPTGNTYTAGKLKDTAFASGFNVCERGINDLWHNSPNLRKLREIAGGGLIHGLDSLALKERADV